MLDSTQRYCALARGQKDEIDHRKDQGAQQRAHVSPLAVIATRSHTAWVIDAESVCLLTGS
jgi:hypothetical protein